ncbi:MAG: hypothetical protein AAGG02_14920 [Cyanobacteria bacterium P01_H01_bin.15]
MTEIILTLISTGTLGTTINYFLEAKKAKARLREYYASMLDHVHEIYSILNKLVRKTNADRIIILKREEENGSWWGKQYTTSVIFEAYDHPLHSVRNKWQRQLLDDHYIKSLRLLEESGKIELLVEELPKSILKTHLEATGVQKAEWHLISTSPFFVYISFNHTNTDGAECTHAENTKRHLINRLRTIFQEFKV